jgi:hypothetical protein
VNTAQLAVLRHLAAAEDATDPVAPVAAAYPELFARVPDLTADDLSHLEARGLVWSSVPLWSPVRTYGLTGAGRALAADAAAL